MEDWRDIKGFEGLYQVSSEGRIRSLDRYVRVGNSGKRLAKGRIIKPVICTNGYREASLQKEQKRKVILLHRLVAMTFIPNPNNYREVNHKDEDITNNCVDNLEWCTSKQNANYGTRNARCRQGNSRFFKKVRQIDKNTGKIIKTWDCVMDAARALSIDDSHIRRVCQHKKQNVTAGGFKWEYAV